jgi:two-component system cell cycle sensor histidine kinase/response regulator CckA
MPSHRILIVDDRPIERDYLRTVLTSAGYALQEASDGAEALEVAGNFRPDLVVTDIMMPTMDGYELARQIRAYPGLDCTRLIFYSATLRQEEASALADALGAARFVVKPVDPEVLLEMVAHVLSDAAPPSLATDSEIERMHLRLLTDKLAEKTDALEIEVMERRQVEARLRRSQARTQAILDSAMDAIVTFDEAGFITEANPAAEQMFGLGRDRFVGQPLLNTLFPPASRDSVQKEIIEARVRNGTPQPARRTKETAALHQRGHEFPVELVITHAHFEGGTIATAQIRDMTAQKQLEEQFLRAQRLESIGTLASGVAHDLNNILTPILLSIPLLYEDLTQEQREAILGTIELSAQRGTDIVKQVLTFARGVEGERTPIQPLWLLQDILKITRETFPKNLEISQTHTAKLWRVTGDSTQLHQILLNLCLNARDAMPDGGILKLHGENFTVDEQYASAFMDAKPGAYVLLKVSDTGSGIRPELLGRIFDPFFSTKTTAQGTGLGLSTVLGIVKSHGGFINVRTTLGQGTSFEVFLPASQEELDHIPPGETIAPPRGNDELVLVVDDEESIRVITQATLQQHGYRVITAEDGPSAVATFAEHREEIDLLLTDLVMPYLDGIALSRAVRKLKPALKILVSFDDGSEPRTGELESLGITNVLRKPCSSLKMLKAVHEIIYGYTDEPIPKAAAIPTQPAPKRVGTTPSA